MKPKKIKNKINKSAVRWTASAAGPSYTQAVISTADLAKVLRPPLPGRNLNRVNPMIPKYRF